MFINRHTKIVYTIALTLMSRQFFAMDKEMAKTPFAGPDTVEWCLIMGCIYGDLDYITCLFSKYPEINVDARDEDGRTALMEASERGRIDIVYYLTEHGADINAEDSFFGETPLHMAVRAGAPEVVNFLAQRMAPRQALYALLTCEDLVHPNDPLEQFPPEHINYMLKPLIAAALAGQ